MIFTFTFEELQALRAGARVVLNREIGGRSTAVAAPPEVRVRVETLLGQIDGGISLHTVADQRRARAALDVIVDALLARMHEEIDLSHPAAEPAVAAYFEYAHARSVLHRIREIGDEMVALIEVVTGAQPDDLVAETFEFPD
ncbi:MAG: hypothetical protein RQ745_10160 [Longimicrobiales bacterium]|nr:hypothetical protein [Longimicrobiales bacterium]